MTTAKYRAKKWLVLTYMFTATICVFVTQILGLPLLLFGKNVFRKYISITKKLCGVLFASMTELFSPTPVTVYYDEELRNQFFLDRTGCLESIVPPRTVVIANHQLYSDWVYLWWMAYTSNNHGNIFIMLKDSLKWVPILGWGMQFYRFIFLSRTWQKDQKTMRQRFDKIRDPKLPATLIMFPEGTNLVENTYNRSANYAKKIGVPCPKHLMLPRVRGLFFTLQQLRDTMTYLYDYTICFEDIAPCKYAADKFPLSALFFDSVRIDRVHMYVRRFRIEDIPTDEALFTDWLYTRWLEKDKLVDEFTKTKRFPCSKPLSTTIRLKRKLEILPVYTVVIFVIAFFIHLFSGFRIPLSVYFESTLSLNHVLSNTSKIPIKTLAVTLTMIFS
ncbi:1-acylglycerol-3-phosphate acyltransferase [Schizosaccharomyces japonicus yFS275]|uniref:1-acylglycerol-3-phosphate acyltransferase n=1 Tax=Schizosaccharomyces japonicus (strain yFS275 / FY16936) TaxID=402676 RepID=B6K5G0_SCHJY|nr:1-acylglycerol-3-phosphate acyltransferase [Schizosaccharomyces japonicus yFS275]EEB08764.1 1-acylglycerol-3-phosphate acyltransferase [Schizosaccharomyces japonicus yFS275]